MLVLLGAVSGQRCHLYPVPPGPATALAAASLAATPQGRLRWRCGVVRAWRSRMAHLPSPPAAVRPEIRVFLEDIKSHPEDDTPRLILADWLQENGTPDEAARGELLRIE